MLDYWRFIYRIAGLVLMAGAGAFSAAAEPQRSVRAEIELIAEYAQASHATPIWMALRLRPDPGWHVYWRNPGDSGLPPQLVPMGNFTDTRINFVWPLPQEISVGSLTDYGYRQELVLPFRLTTPAQGEDWHFQAKAEWLICKTICIPEAVELVFELPLGAIRSNDREEQTGMIAAALAAAPKPFTGQAHTSYSQTGYYLSLADPELAELAGDATHIRFFPYDHAIEHGGEQTVRFGKSGVRLALSSENPAADRKLTGVLVLEDEQGWRRGWEISAPPGPVLAGTDTIGLLPMQRLVEATPVRQTSLVAVIVFALMAFAGGLLLNLMPCVLPVLAVKASALIASAQAGQAQSRRQALAYMAGIVTCFVATASLLLGLRAAGETVGLGFHLQYPPLIAALALLMSAIGFNLLGLFSLPGFGGGETLEQQTGVRGSFWTGALAALVGAPCIGPFMAAALASVVTQPAFIVMLVFIVMGLGMALPMTLIGSLPALASRLPGPGAWMVHLRQGLAFPMFLTTIWLAWVLAGQAGNNAGYRIIVCAVGLGFGLWLLNISVNSRMGRVSGWSAIMLAIALALLPVTGEPEPHTPETASWSPEQVAKAQAQGRGVFIDFTARWCLTCQFNKRTVLSRPEIERLMAAKDVLVLTADWTGRDAAIGSELARYGRAGVPFYLYFPPGSEPPHILPSILTPAIIRQTLAGP